MVEGTCVLSDLSPQLSGFQRRRHRGHPRSDLPAGLPAMAGHRCGMALPGLRLAQRRYGLRHPRLPEDHVRIRHDGGLRPTAGGNAPAGHQAGHGPGRQPFLGRERMVCRIQKIKGQSLPRLLHLARRTRREGAEQLVILLHAVGMEL